MNARSYRRTPVCCETAVYLVLSCYVAVVVAVAVLF